MRLTISLAALALAIMPLAVQAQDEGRKKDEAPAAEAGVVFDAIHEALLHSSRLG